MKGVKGVDVFPQSLAGKGSPYTTPSHPVPLDSRVGSRSRVSSHFLPLTVFGTEVRVRVHRRGVSRLGRVYGPFPRCTRVTFRLRRGGSAVGVLP